ncbi:MAG TPA: hypothetical protein VJB94_03880 [Candidatus Nanoarchaeia archaeon]|nr:hypothetical protein [Candidatus Nanoarchaeia archaeon]
MKNKIKLFNENKLSYEDLIRSFEGWKAYARWANSRNIMKKIAAKINESIL